MNKKVHILAHSWGRSDFVSHLIQRKCCVGAEIGVYNGEFSLVLWRNLSKYFKDSYQLYLIDPYKEFLDTEYSDPKNEPQRIQDIRYKMVCELFKEVPRIEVLRITSMEALNHIPDNSLDFVYIDANHTEKYVLEDIYGWAKKVKEGGIISGHDWDEWHQSVRRAAIKGADDLSKAKNLIIFESARIWSFEKGSKVQQFKKETEDE